MGERYARKNDMVVQTKQVYVIADSNRCGTGQRLIADMNIY